MGKGIKKLERVQEIEPVSLGELIHAQVRGAIEAAVHESWRRRSAPYERTVRARYRNGVKARTLTARRGRWPDPAPGTLFAAAGEQEWTSTLLRYQRRVREVNEAVVGTYLAGGNQRRIGAAAAAQSGAAVQERGLARRRHAQARAGGVDGPLPGRARRRLPVPRRSGPARPQCEHRGERSGADGGRGARRRPEAAAGPGAVQQRVGRGVARLPRRPGGPGPHGPPAVHHRRPPGAAAGGRARLAPGGRAALLRAQAAQPRAQAPSTPSPTSGGLPSHRLRGHRRRGADAYRRSSAGLCCPASCSLQEGDELLTFFSFPKAQWKTLRTTNAIERLNEEFRRRVKTQGSLPTEDAALILLFGLVASGQITLRKIDGYTKIATVISTRLTAAA